MLADTAQLDGAAEEPKRLWQWHAIEEVEHKAVAYDTYLHATRDMLPLRRWLKRSAVMVVTSIRFHYVLFRGIADLLRQDGRNDLATWRGLLSCLYSRSGLMRPLLREMFAYMRPGFHPWDADDRPLLAKALAAFEVAAPRSQMA